MSAYIGQTYADQSYTSQPFNITLHHALTLPGVIPRTEAEASWSASVDELDSELEIDEEKS